LSIRYVEYGISRRFLFKRLAARRGIPIPPRPPPRLRIREGYAVPDGLNRCHAFRSYSADSTSLKPTEEKSLKVLTVDDDPGVRELIEDFLKARGYDVYAVGSGEAALEEIRRDRPDLLILDLMMPGMNGMEVLRRLREEGEELPVIVATAVTEEEVGRAALRQGARDYVTKPIDLAYLERSIAALLLSRER
jgi:CheY-like chemotaxis protein